MKKIALTRITEKGWKSYGPLYIRQEWCKRCGICVEFCPKKVLALDEERGLKVIKPKECTTCRLCELRCPDFAIWVAKK